MSHLQTVAATLPRIEINVWTARHVLHYLGDHNRGVDGGHFVNRLLATASAADEVNREKLRVAFPELVVAYLAAQYTSWGLDWLRAVVGLDLDAESVEVELPDSGHLPAGHMQVGRHGEVVSIPPARGRRYVITECSAAGPEGRHCTLPPAHDGPHSATVGRRWA
ncbi:hypothetical protein QE428_002637 [Microbacterium sp. SORGH_AS 505]|uniref:hypothetical protein n=1 Tax=Microbacterium sp. SORGH_AS_0505 TaxID=3041770 RepID=UPI002783BC2F|nr:hypothetical protein [Microbacterium sp. SORGH_AS_0505]MDQ1127604.1 hypothetical protein [Microbacterium sp. SORGH_AS_0505]